MEAPDEMEKTDQSNDQAMDSTPGLSNNLDKPENGSTKKGSGTKGKKRKKTMKDHTAPRQPLTGYIRFLNDRRDTVRNENPSLPFAEITKLLAGEWMNLPADEKQQYLDAAEQDRERYLQELNAYKKTEAYRLFTQKQADKKQKEESQEDDIPEKEPENVFTGFDIPIFTEEFLDHNKAREAELRQFRKSNTDYEQQNAILQKHMENMRAAVDKLTLETQMQLNHNNLLRNHLQHIKSSLAVGFSNLPLPGTKETATLQNIENYMNKVNSILMDPSVSNVSFINSVKDVISRLELNG
uniref:HMG box domain-containing protein n=1 Tax=Graphocephala atropunctata TaxID=36148 RepID=A0A1B6KX33_9HEMI